MKINALICSLLILVLSSCQRERGCTDPKAINYNVTADEDDGSCIICTQSKNEIGHKDVYLVDDYYWSPYYNQVVGVFYLNQHVTEFSNELCGVQTGDITLTIKSYMDKKMQIEYYMYDYSGPTSFSSNGNIIIDSKATVYQGLIKTLESPPFFPITNDSIVLRLNSPIVYY